MSDLEPENKEPGSLTLRQRVLAMSLAAIAGIAFSFLIWQFVDPQNKEPVSVPSGIADIGGPFSLTSHEGHQVTDQDFRGRWMLIYFGYTWCPDVCPLALQFMGDTLGRVETGSARLQPLFITVDPERDTPDAIRDYLGSFHPDLVGLTGSPEAIAEVAGSYKMYYRKTEPLDGANPENYGMDHMNIFYLMDPDGHYAAHYMSPTSPAEVAARISEVIADRES